jgi:hypothetical protein
MLGLFNFNRVGTLSGGTWLAALPVTNGATEDLTQKARSNGDGTSATQFDCDMGATYSIRAFAIVGHNLSADAQWRISIGTTSGGSDVYAGSWRDVWQITKPEGMTGEDFAAIYVTPLSYSGRYVRVEFDDTTNPDSYVEFGRAFIGSGIASRAIHDSYQDGVTALSEIDRADGGQKWYVERDSYRWASFVLPNLDNDTTALVHDMLRRDGIVSEVLFVPSLEDMAYSQRWGFLGDLTEPSAIEYPFSRRHSWPCKIEERL